MTDKQNQPRDYDAVLGGQSPPPMYGVVLGGIEGVKNCLSSPVMEVRIAALSEALKYGDAGLDVVRQALQDESKLVRRFAYRVLKQRVEPQVIQALQVYKTWNLEERFGEYQGYQGNNVTQFANRQVIEFDPNIGITEPINKAYALRCEHDEYAEDLPSKLSKLLQQPNAQKLKALVFGLWAGASEGDSSSDIAQALVDAKEYLTSLKAVFIGDIAFDEFEISWIRQSDISPILQAYPQLEILQIRGGDRLQFSPPVRHNHLKALIVETGGLSRDK